MTYVTKVFALLLVGLFTAISASADDRLTVSGSLDNQYFGVSNLSGFDYNHTSLVLPGNMQPGNEDDFVLGVTRAFLAFNVEAFENTRFVLTTITDQFWGTVAGNSGADDGHGYRPDNYDSLAIRLNNFYVDTLIPGSSATLRVGGVPFGAQRLKGCVIHCLDTAGFTITAPFSDTVNTYTWYSHFSDEWDGVRGKGAGGESWAAGTRVELSPMEGLELDLIYAYQRLDCNEQGPNDACSIRTLQLRSTSQDGENASSYVSLENRHWAGIDMRYQYGDFTLSPTVLLHFGSTELVGGGESDISSFMLDVEMGYQTGPLMLRGRVAYTPGDPATDDLGDGSTLNSWQVVGTFNANPIMGWFSLWGPRNMQIYPFMFNYSSGRSLDTRLSFDQFGLMLAAARAEYTVNPRTTLTGSLGIFNAAEDVGRPARLGPMMVEKKASIVHDTTEADGHKESPAEMVANNPTYNYTGQDTHLATEVDVELTYALNPVTDLTLWAAYSMNGDALNLMREDGTVAESEDTVGGGVRLLYSF